MTTAASPPSLDLQAFRAAVYAGHTDKAIAMATAAGQDPAKAFARAWNIAAGYGDVDHHLDLHEIKALQAVNADAAVDRLLAEHGGRRSCDDFLGFWYDRSIGSVHNRDLPRAVHRALEGKALTPDEAEVAVQMAWKMPEWPEQNLSAPAWRRMFKAVGYLDDTDGEQPRPTGPVTLYRGAIAEHRRGMAWTSDRAKAEWFANRFPPTPGSPFTQGLVWTATVDPKRVLARFGGRGESEYVLDTRSLRVDPA